MKKIILLAITIASAINDSTAQKTNKAANKQVVLSFLKECWGDKSEAAVDKLISPDYIQHNPFSGDGPASIKAMFPYISPKVHTVRSIAEGDLVLQHNISTGWGDTLTYISFDVFRIKKGQIIEHWDVMQHNEFKTVSGRTMTDGDSVVKDLKKTKANKKVVQGFFDDCVYGHNWQNITKYISAENYYQHNPNIGDGLQGFNDAMKRMAENKMTMTFEKTYRIIAEGNFVFVHSKGEFGGKKVAFADLMRLENGKIVEHWDAIQEIPAQTKSGHDMFEQLTK